MTTTLISAGAPADHVARTARAHGLPGRRTVAAIRALRRERAATRAAGAATTPQQRLWAALVARYTPEIVRRGGEITIDGKSTSVGLRVIDRAVDARSGSRLTLLGADGWRHYSSRTPARHVSLRYIVGYDDNGPWAARVAGSVTTVHAAIKALTPADVRDAYAAGRPVARQGDVYAIGTTATHDAPAGPVDVDGAHVWDPTTRVLTHVPADGRAHAPLHLPHPVRFVQQSTYGMGRGFGRGPAD